MWEVRSLSVAALAAWALCGAAYAETLEEVERKALELWGRHRSYSAKVEMRMDMPVPGGQSRITNEGVGRFEWLRVGDRAKYRMEVKTKMVTTVSDQSIPPIEQETVSVCDGQTTITLSKGMGRQTAMRNTIDVSQPTSTDGLFGAARGYYEFTLLPAPSDGPPVWVIEATPTKPIPRMPAKKVHYHLAQDTGAIVRVLWFNDAGAQINDTKFSELKFDEPIEESRFELQIPEGVPVIDRTGRDKP